MTHSIATLLLPLRQKVLKAIKYLPRSVSEHYRTTWPKHLLIGMVGVMMSLNVRYLTLQFMKRETAWVTTFSFSNTTTKLLFPGLQLCVPQLFRWYKLNELDILFLHGKSAIASNKTEQWRPNLSDVVLSLSINGELLEANSFFVEKLDRYYRVCWRSKNHKYFSRAPGAIQQIEMIVDVAEYADIVHRDSNELRHMELIPLDQNLQDSPDKTNALYLSPGRHSLIGLTTVNVDSTIRPPTSVSCSKHAYFDICRQLIEKNFIRKSCKDSISDTVHQMSVARYVDCSEAVRNIHEHCKTSCQATLYKSFKSEAKIKFVKDFRNLPMASNLLPGIKQNVHVSVERNSKYSDEYRRPVMQALPSFVNSTFQLLTLLRSTNSQMKIARKLAKLNLNFDLLHKKQHYFDLLSHSRSFVRLFMALGKMTVKSYIRAFSEYIQAVLSKNGHNVYYSYYMSRGPNDIAPFRNPFWHRHITNLGRMLSNMYSITERILHLKIARIAQRGSVESTFASSLRSTASRLFASHEFVFVNQTRKMLACFSHGGEEHVFTNDWYHESTKHLLVNEATLYSESGFGSNNLTNWYRRARKESGISGMPVYIDNVDRKKILLPIIVVFHCLYYKSYSDHFEQSLGIDQMFSFSKTNSQYKVHSNYTLFILNNILNTADHSWHLRDGHQLDRCDEESCACQAVGRATMIGPDYLPPNATVHQIMDVARSRSLPNYFGRLQKALVQYQGTIGKCTREWYNYQKVADTFFSYFNEMLLKPFDKSMTILKQFSATYQAVRRTDRMRTFKFLLKTYSLKRRLAKLHTHLTGVLKGDSFENMAVYLAKKGKALSGQIRFILDELDHAHKEYVNFLDGSSAIVEEVAWLAQLKPVSQDDHFLADIFNDTANSVFREEVMVKLHDIIESCRATILDHRLFLDTSFSPLDRTIREWLNQVNLFIVRARRYVASKEVSKAFLNKNIVILSMFYDTLDVRLETATYKYPASQYRSDWGSMLGFYYGLNILNGLHILLLLHSMIVRWWLRV